jgi:hypothetical protein
MPPGIRTLRAAGYNIRNLRSARKAMLRTSGAGLSSPRAHVADATAAGKQSSRTAAARTAAAAGSASTGKSAWQSAASLAGKGIWAGARKMTRAGWMQDPELAETKKLINRAGYGIARGLRGPNYRRNSLMTAYATYLGASAMPLSGDQYLSPF